jgi:hypothetical protein
LFKRPDASADRWLAGPGEALQALDGRVEPTVHGREGPVGDLAEQAASADTPLDSVQALPRQPFCSLPSNTCPTLFRI